MNAKEMQSAAMLAPCVAICTVGELFGGVERHVLGIQKGLAAEGIRTLLVLFHDGELAKQAREQGIEIIVLPRSNISLLATSKKLAHIIKERWIPIVHSHGYKAMVFCAAARWWHRFSIVKTEHGLPESMLGKPIRAARDRLYHTLDDLATWAIGATVCFVSDDLRQHRRAANLHPSVVIPNGVEPIHSRSLPRPAEFSSDRFNLVIIGRLEKVKGHALAIKAIAATGMPPDLHLHVIGAGPDEAALRRLSEASSIKSQISFWGFRRNVYDYIAHCDGLLMPSLHEGLPYTLLEAMALGTPVIASQVGGLAEVLEDGVTALLFPPGDTPALARLIKMLRENPTLCATLSENARRVQRTKYSLTAMARAYIDVYRAVEPSANWPSMIHQ